VFLHESTSSWPPKVLADVFFEVFRKIAKKFVTQGAPPVSTTLAENGKKFTEKLF